MSSEFDPEVGPLLVNGQPDPPGRMRFCGVMMAACLVYAAAVWDAVVAINYAGAVNVATGVNAWLWTFFK